MSEERGPDIYCDEVLSGRLPVRTVVETEHVLALHHPRPYWPLIHVVVIPKQHVASILDVKDDVLVELFGVVRRVARDLLAEHGACRIETFLGEYQHNKHLHVHVSSGPPPK